MSERTYRRQFDQFCDFPAINAQVYAFGGAKPYETATASHPAIAVMDCSFIPKSGKQTDGLDQFYNGSHSRVEQGLEVSLLGVVDVATQTGYALSATQTAATGEFPELSRLDQAIDDLERHRALLPAQVRYLVVDGFYAKAPFIDAAALVELDVISKLRRDANLRYLFTGQQKPRGAKRKYADKVDLSEPSRFEFVSDLQPGVKLYSAVLWHMSLKRLVRLAYLQDGRKAGKTGYVVLFSTDIEQSALEIYQFYKLRFQIEFIFRDAKQFTGLSDCQARSAKKLDFHFNASFLALNLAKLEAMESQGNAEPMVFSMVSIKRRALNEHLLEAFIAKLDLSPTVIKSHPNYRNLCSYGTITA